MTSALVGGEWSASRLCRFTSGEGAPGTHWKGSWVDPRAGLDEEKNVALPGLGSPIPFDVQLYRLRYPGS
jgi:hypothetical protein